MATEQPQWHWQEPNTAWKGIGIYHITLTITDRRPLLGKLSIPNKDPKQARIDYTELGNKVLAHLLALPKRHPEIKVVSYCLMPDHLHTIWHVTQPMQTGILSVVRGFWQGEKKIGRAFSLSLSLETLSTESMSITPDCIRNTPTESMSVPPHSMRQLSDPLFHEMPHVTPLSHKGQLDAMINYVLLNPQRFATKQLLPGFFRVQDNIVIAGRTYSAVGNTKLLLKKHFSPVHVHSDLVRDAEENGHDQPLRDYMNGCVKAARQGAVMVSPFISKKEKEVLVVLLAEGHDIIFLTDNGFRDYYKPSAGLFDSVAAGHVLILSPWPYDPKKKRVSRSECIAMNGMAEEICDFYNPSIPDHGSLC